MLKARSTISQEFSLERLSALWALDRPGVFWRHDVDHDLACAALMATWEQQFGIRSTYYLRTDDAAYYCDSREFRWAVEHILRCGHELGTHVDPGVPREAVVSDFLLEAACENQASKLALWPVGRRVSLHRPGPDLLWREIDGFDHALEPRWKGRYVSDSRNRFRSDPERLLRSAEPVQVNLHPCWWFLSALAAKRLREQHEALV